MKYQAIIFDLDGVLCHTDEFHYQAWRELAGKLGIPFDRVANEKMKGLSRMDSLERLLGRWSGDFTPEEKAEMARDKNQRYQELLRESPDLGLDPDARCTLEEIRAKGIPMAIGSSSKNAPLILELMGLTDFFDAVADGTMITRGKPHPEVFLHAASLLGVPQGGCLVVEDAESGIQAARAAGMDAALIGNIDSDPPPDYRLSRLWDLIEIIG